MFRDFAFLIKVNIKTLLSPTDTKQRVIQLHKEEWEKLSKQVAHNSVASHPRRCQQVIHRKGEPIDY
jgi:hypothetical protein